MGESAFVEFAARGGALIVHRGDAGIPRASTREITPLTGLRGAAAFLVILYHFGQPPTDQGVPSQFHIPKGYIAVDSFFILSGFVLAYNYATAFAPFRITTYGDFLMRRFARIYPAYFGIAAIYILKLYVNVSSDQALLGYTTKDKIANLFIATGWGFDIKPVIGVSWSVSAEFLCYFLFPVLVWLACRRTHLSTATAIGAVVVGYCVVGVSGLGAKGWLDVVTSGSLVPAVRALSGFVLGLILFDIYDRARPGTRWSDALTLVAFVGIGLGIALDDDLIVLTSVAALVFGLCLDGRVARAIFANPAAMYLGRISYSLYLVHAMVIAIAFRLLSHFNGKPEAAAVYWLGLATFIVTCLLLATASYDVFEVRGKRLMMAAHRRGRDLVTSHAGRKGAFERR